MTVFPCHLKYSLCSHNLCPHSVKTVSKVPAHVHHQTLIKRHPLRLGPSRMTVFPCHLMYSLCSHSRCPHSVKTVSKVPAHMHHQTLPRSNVYIVGYVASGCQHQSFSCTIASFTRYQRRNSDFLGGIFQGGGQRSMVEAGYFPAS